MGADLPREIGLLRFSFWRSGLRSVFTTWQAPRTRPQPNQPPSQSQEQVPRRSPQLAPHGSQPVLDDTDKLLCGLRRENVDSLLRSRSGNQVQGSSQSQQAGLESSLSRLAIMAFESRKEPGPWEAETGSNLEDTFANSVEELDSLRIKTEMRVLKRGRSSSLWRITPHMACLDEGRLHGYEGACALMFHCFTVAESTPKDPSHSWEWMWPILGVLDPEAKPGMRLSPIYRVADCSTNEPHFPAVFQRRQKRRQVQLFKEITENFQPRFDGAQIRLLCDLALVAYSAVGNGGDKFRPLPIICARLALLRAGAVVPISDWLPSSTCCHDGVQREMRKMNRKSLTQKNTNTTWGRFPHGQESAKQSNGDRDDFMTQRTFTATSKGRVENKTVAVDAKVGALLRDSGKCDGHAFSLPQEIKQTACNPKLSPRISFSATLFRLQPILLSKASHPKRLHVPRQAVLVDQKFRGWVERCTVSPRSRSRGPLHRRLEAHPIEIRRDVNQHH